MNCMMIAEWDGKKKGKKNDGKIGVIASTWYTYLANVASQKL